MDKTTFRSTSLQLINAGHAVVPLHGVFKPGRCACGNTNSAHKCGKHPAISNYFNSPLRTAEDIERFLAGEWACPSKSNGTYIAAPPTELNIAVITGEGFIVLDVDVKHVAEEGESRDGRLQLAKLEAKFGPIPRDATVESGSGGEHIYLAVPPDLRLRSGRLGDLQDVEVKAHRSTIVVAPSTHASGRPYVGPCPLLNGSIPLAPQWLLDHIPRITEKSPTSATPEFPPANASKVFAGCALLKHLNDNPDDASRDIWLGALTNLVCCEDGENVAMEFSRGYSNFDETEVEGAIAEARSNMKPRTCRSFRQETLASGKPAADFCDSCAFGINRDFASSPVMIGTDTPKGAAEQHTDDKWVLTYGELLNEVGNGNLREAVIPGFAYKGRLTLFSSREKTGKSTVCRFMVLGLVITGEFAGEPVAKGPVLWVGLEEAEEDLVQELSEMGFPSDPTDPRTRDLHTTRRYIPNGVAALRVFIELHHPKLVIIDTLVKWGPQAAEGEPIKWSAADQIAKVVNDLADLSHDTGVAIVLNHHATKDDSGYRDSTAIGAAVDHIVHMTIDKAMNGKPARENVRHFKVVGRFSVPNFSLIKAAEGLRPLDGEPINPRETVLAFIRKNPGSSKSDVVRGCGGRKQVILQAIDYLLTHGKIIDRGEGQASRLHVAGGPDDGRSDGKPGPIGNSEGTGSGTGSTPPSEPQDGGSSKFTGNASGNKAEPIGNQSGTGGVSPAACGPLGSRALEGLGTGGGRGEPRIKGWDYPRQVVADPDAALAAVDALLASDGILGVDIETAVNPEHDNALNPHHSRIRLVQVFDGAQVYIFDIDAVGIETLRPVLETKAWVAHNAAFELKFFLHAGLNPTLPHCSMLLASAAGFPTSGLKDLVADVLDDQFPADKGYQRWDWNQELDDEAIQYAAADAIATYRLYQSLAPGYGEAAVYAEAMRPCILPVAEMELRGIPADIEGINALVKESEGALASPLASLRELVSDPNITPSHTSRLSEWIDAHKPDSTRWPRAEKSGQYKTDSATLKRLHEKGQDLGLAEPILALRKAKTDLDHARALRDHYSPDTGCVHGSFKIAGAATGRFSSSDPNLQNVPRDSFVRRQFRAPEGYSLIRADYSQIELRVAAVHTKCQAMLEAFGQGGDLHDRTARIITNTPEGQPLPKGARTKAKAVNFGLLYGQQAKGLIEYARANYGVKLTPAEASSLRAKFFEAYPEIGHWHAGIRGREQDRYVEETALGRVRDLQRTGRGEYWANAHLNTPIQGSAAEIMQVALVKLRERLRSLDAWIVSTVHDEVLVVANDDCIKATGQAIYDALIDAATAVLPGIPTKNLVQPVVGKTWDEARDDSDQGRWVGSPNRTDPDHQVGAGQLPEPDQDSNNDRRRN